MRARPRHRCQQPVTQQDAAHPAHLPVHVPAEAGGQALGPQDQVALVTEAIQQDVALLVLGVPTVVHKGHYVSLQQTQMEASPDGRNPRIGPHTLSPVSRRRDQPLCGRVLPGLQSPTGHPITSTSSLRFQHVT